MDSSPSVSSVHGISQARILDWVAISFYRGSCQLRDQTHNSCLAGKFFTNEPPGKTFLIANSLLVVFSVIWKLNCLLIEANLQQKCFINISQTEIIIIFISEIDLSYQLLMRKLLIFCQLISIHDPHIIIIPVICKERVIFNRTDKQMFSVTAIRNNIGTI